MLTRLAHAHAPNLVVEHAMAEEFISNTDVLRTYDVENIISQPVTISRIASLLK